MTKPLSRPKNAVSQAGDPRSPSLSGDAWGGGTAKSGETEPTMRPADAAEYIAHMTAELARIARTARLEPLAYFLEMARIEATSCLRRIETRR